MKSSLNTCLCCSEQLLRHIRQSSIYWFCPRCKQEMPPLKLNYAKLNQKFRELSSEKISDLIKIG